MCESKKNKECIIPFPFADSCPATSEKAEPGNELLAMSYMQKYGILPLVLEILLLITFYSMEHPFA